MPPESREPAYLWDMLDAARSIQQFTAGVSFDDYLQHEMMQRAVERELQIIGEAARRLSDALRNAHPEIPWNQMIGWRNVLAHEYGAIKQDRLWSVVTGDLPGPIKMLEPLIPPLPPDSA